MKKKLEIIATEILNNIDDKPNYNNRDFMNALIIFQSALMDKMYDNQDYDKMNVSERYKMAESCGNQLHKLIHTFTGLDTHELENFL
jgi:hypothetical protein